MITRLALLLALLAGCADRSLTRALLADDEGPVARAALEDVVERVRRRMNAGRPFIAAVNTVVWDELAYAREVEADPSEPRFMRLGAVLATRRGSCVGLSALYLAVAEALGQELSAVLVPGHVFVRAEGRNVELLRRGEAMPDGWYRAKYGVPDAPAYFRALTKDEFLGVVDYNLGNHHRARAQWPAARAAYGRAVGRFPQLAEAHASLGLVLQLEGALDEAARAYRAAAVQHPTLPGLARNRALLEAEVARRSTQSM